MGTYQIEATIEKFSQDEKSKQCIALLKGMGKYLFEKSSKKKKEEEESKEYWNILEAENSQKLEFVDSKKEFPVAISTNELGMQHLLGYAFAEKKKLKFTLEDKPKKYTITAVSHAST